MSAADDLVALRKIIQRPPPHSSWSHERFIEFRAEVCQALYLLRKERPAPGAVATCLHALRSYHEAPADAGVAR